MKQNWTILLVVALTLRLIASFYWDYRVGDDKFYFGDSDTYWVLGQAIAEGKPYDYGGNQIHRMPGYPAVLALLFIAFKGHPPILAARIENAILGTLTVAAVGWLAMILFKNRKIALIAGWITAIDPLNVVMSSLVLSEAPFCLAMVLQLAFWAKAFQGKTKISWGPAITAGLFSAAAVYCRPDWLLFVPFAIVVGTILSPRNFKPILLTGSVALAVLALCMTPWWYRNYQVSGHFVGTTLQAGPSLFDGLNPNANGGSNMDFVDDFRNTEISLTPDASKSTLEYRLNQKMKQAALKWAWNHPKLVWELATSKFVRLWNIWPNEQQLASLGVKIAVSSVFIPVLIFGLIGILYSFGRDFPVRLLWIPAVYITALHIIFVSSIRYRAPAMLCLAILAAWAFTDIFLPKPKSKKTVKDDEIEYNSSAGRSSAGRSSASRSSAGRSSIRR